MRCRHPVVPILGSLVLIGATVRAQDLPPAPELVSPPPPPAPVATGGVADGRAIAGCLCAQRRLQGLHQAAAEANRAFKEARIRLDELNRRMSAGNAAVDVNDPAQVDAQRALVEADERSTARLQNTLLPAAQAAVDRYNKAVGDYNAACAGRLMDRAAFAAVSQTLACPDEP